MTATVVGPGRSAGGPAWEYLLQSWRELDVPKGWRAEIDGGRITLEPPAHRHHHGIAARVQRALYDVRPPECGVYQTLGIHIAPLDELYVPDLVLAPRGVVEGVAADVSDPVDAAEALLVVEITSQGNRRGRPEEEALGLCPRPGPGVPPHRPFRRARAHGHAVHRPRERCLPAPRTGRLRRGAQAPRAVPAGAGDGELPPLTVGDRLTQLRRCRSRRPGRRLRRTGRPRPRRAGRRPVRGRGARRSRSGRRGRRASG